MKSIIVKTGLEILDFINAMIGGFIAVVFYLLESLVAGGMAWTRFRRNMRSRSLARVSVDHVAHSSTRSTRLQRNYRIAA